MNADEILAFLEAWINPQIEGCPFKTLSLALRGRIKDGRVEYRVGAGGWQPSLKEAILANVEMCAAVSRARDLFTEGQEER